MDTAVDLRVSCAIGLAATAYPRALIPLVELLHDPEPHCRSGAVRAMACTQPLAAEAVLRSKALAGDAEVGVTGDCLVALLQVAAEDALDFVAGFLDSPDPTLSELASLALGDSHLDAALDLLRERWDAQPLKRDADRVLLRAAALHRSEAAFAWLIDVATRSDRSSALRVIDELAAYRASDRLRGRLRLALEDRGDPGLLARFEERFGAPGDKG